MEAADASFWSALAAFEYWPEIGTATVDTLIMTGLSLVFTILLGLPIGVALFLTGPQHRSPSRAWPCCRRVRTRSCRSS